MQFKLLVCQNFNQMALNEEASISGKLHQYLLWNLIHFVIAFKVVFCEKKDFESERADRSIDWKRLSIMPIVVRKGIYVESGIIMSIWCSLQIVETDLNHTRLTLIFATRSFHHLVYQYASSSSRNGNSGNSTLWIWWMLCFRYILADRWNVVLVFLFLTCQSPRHSLNAMVNEQEQSMTRKYSWTHGSVNETNHVYFMFYLALRCSHIQRVHVYEHTLAVFVYKVKLLFF